MVGNNSQLAWFVCVGCPEIAKRSSYLSYIPRGSFLQVAFHSSAHVLCYKIRIFNLCFKFSHIMCCISGDKFVFVLGTFGSKQGNSFLYLFACWCVSLDECILVPLHTRLCLCLSVCAAIGLAPCAWAYVWGLLLCVRAAQAEVVTEGQGSPVYVLYSGWGEDSCVLPDAEWLETRSGHRQLLPEPRPLLQRIHENLSGQEEAWTALQSLQRQVRAVIFFKIITFFVVLCLIFFVFVTVGVCVCFRSRYTIGIYLWSTDLCHFVRMYRIVWRNLDNLHR